MLVLTRKLGERIAIGDDIFITLLEIRGSQARIGIEAPDQLGVYRQEIYEKVRSENLKSSEVIAPDLSAADWLLASKETRIKER